MRNNNKIERITTVDGKNYKLQLIKDKTAKNLHHILWRCNRNEYNTDHQDNKIMVNEIGHDNLNKFFGNRQSVHSQLLYLLKDRWREKVLNKAVVDELYWLLALPRELFYDEKFVKDKHKWKSLFSDDRIYKDNI